MIEGNFQFHPVGHGLFYSGQISSANHINFVFDCGKSKFENNCQKIREACINNYLKRNHVQKIDMLFISHLHDDHINGIPYLLSSINNNCERVILPYFTPFQRLFLVAEYLFGGDGPQDPQDPNSPNDDSSRRKENDEVLEIIKNPHSYFNEKGINVVYVNGEGNKNENGSDEEYDKEGDDNYNPKDRDLIIDISETDDIDDIISIESEDSDNKKTKNNLSVKILNGNRIRLDRFWKFIVYNGKLDDTEITEFKNKVNEKFRSLIGEKKLITAKILNKIISENENLNGLAEIYRELFKRKINNYGLMLIHRPVLARHRFIELDFCDNKSCYGNLDCFCDYYCHFHFRIRSHYHIHQYYCRHENMFCKSFSTLLTGDRGLKYLLNNDNSNITPELNGVNVFQVPHHGSNTTWKKSKEIDGENSILRYFNDRICKYAIIPCNNSEKFPRPIVLKDLISNSFDIRIVNNIQYEYSINIRKY